MKQGALSTADDFAVWHRAVVSCTLPGVFQDKSQEAFADAAPTTRLGHAPPCVLEHSFHWNAVGSFAVCRTACGCVHQRGVEEVNGVLAFVAQLGHE